MPAPAPDQPNSEIPSPQSIASPSAAWWSLSFGFMLLLGALFCQTVTLVSGDYTNILRVALVLMTAADALFIHAFLRGGVLVRSLSILCLLPTLLFVAEFLRQLLLN